jgi:cytochrome oxidase Cu insertion factor (SCO1/SenC/PrrC family)
MFFKFLYLKIKDAMKKNALIPIVCCGLLFACTNEPVESVQEEETQEAVLTESDLSELEADQEVNVELEQLDGELDSLLSTF